MGDVRYKSQSNQTKANTLDGATKWLRAFFHLKLPELAIFIDWSRPLEVVKRETVTEEDGMRLPQPKELCTIRLFDLEGEPAYFTLSATILGPGLLNRGGHLETDEADPSAN